jgi:hypothetical protein
MKHVEAPSIAPSRLASSRSVTTPLQSPHKHRDQLTTMTALPLGVAAGVGVAVMLLRSRCGGG